MKRSNLMLNTRIYDTYPKYTYSDDVEKFMDKIVDIVSNYRDTDLIRQDIQEKINTLKSESEEEK